MAKADTNNIKPLFDNVLVKPLEPDQKTASGILLPDSVKEKPQKGLVMAVGPKVKQIKVGQQVLYKKWGGNEVKVGTEEWMILEQKDILAIYG